MSFYNRVCLHSDNSLYVLDRLGNIELYSLEGTFDEAIETIQKAKEAWVGCQELYPDRDANGNPKPKYSKIFLDYRACPYYDDEKELAIMGEREPNAEEMVEYNKMLEQQKKFKLAQFEQLKKELGQ